MKIIIAPDSYKECLSAKEICIAIENGFKRVFGDAEYVHLPVADGGEGTAQTLLDALGGDMIELSVTGPLQDTVNGFYGLLNNKKTAIIEMAAASGLHLVPTDKRDPKITTSYGTGELIKHALDQNIEHLIIGLGGSATNDAGVGMLQALGARFLDANENEIPLGGIYLKDITKIDISNLDPRLNNIKIEIACDVDNPLCGSNGASYIFGPQKGATSEDILALDHALENFANITEKQFSNDINSIQGAGAAGGMGAAWTGFTNAKLRSGIDIITDIVNLADHAKNADIVITGEGLIDYQTCHGKAPVGVSKVVKSANPDCHVIAISGGTGKNYQDVFTHGIDAVFPTVPRAMTLGDAFAEAHHNISNTAENIARLLHISL